MNRRHFLQTSSLVATALAAPNFEVEFLKGDNDWPAVMAALDEVGYHGWGIAEEGGANSLDGLRKLSSEMDRIFAA